MADLVGVYRAYLDCLNRQALDELGRFVDDDARHNGRPLGLAGYRRMLETDFRDIPDLRFEAEMIVCGPPHLAARLAFDCTPAGTFLGLPVNGRRVQFAENVFYVFADLKIVAVWSVLEKTAIEAQLLARHER
jgi:predicted ester cyclase